MGIGSLSGTVDTTVDVNNGQSTQTFEQIGNGHYDVSVSVTGDQVTFSFDINHPSSQEAGGSTGSVTYVDFGQVPSGSVSGTVTVDDDGSNGGGGSAGDLDIGAGHYGGVFPDDQSSYPVTVNVDDTITDAESLYIEVEDNGWAAATPHLSSCSLSITLDADGSTQVDSITQA